nr:hypothetical protein Iba_chr13fCG6750 [Ipomoea batatas]
MENVEEKGAPTAAAHAGNREDRRSRGSSIAAQARSRCRGIERRNAACRPDRETEGEGSRCSALSFAPPRKRSPNTLLPLDEGDENPLAVVLRCCRRGVLSSSPPMNVESEVDRNRGEEAHGDVVSPSLASFARRGSQKHAGVPADNPRRSFDENDGSSGSSNKEDDQQWSFRSSLSSSRQYWATAATEFDNTIPVDVNQRNRATGASPVSRRCKATGELSGGSPPDRLQRCGLAVLPPPSNVSGGCSGRVWR